MKKIIGQENGTLTIKGNGHCIPLLNWHELTNKEKKEFNYDNADHDSFFRYKGWIYCLGDFLNIHDAIHFPHLPDYPVWLKEFDGYMNDSFFSGILIKLSNDVGYLKAYTFYS